MIKHASYKDDHKQCDQMARRIFQNLAIYNIQKLPNSIKSCQSIKKNFKKFAKLAKFRPNLVTLIISWASVVVVNVLAFYFYDPSSNLAEVYKMLILSWLKIDEKRPDPISEPCLAQASYLTWTQSPLFQRGFNVIK